MIHIHQEITVGLERILTQGLRQELSMLIFRRYMDSHNIPVKKLFSQMIMPHVDMLQV